MTAKYVKLHNLNGQQLCAVEPDDNIWLSASAGTGKTQVLVARVLRLMLEDDVRPENILCITFTKAGAAEMAYRINKQLTSWVQLDNVNLHDDLQAIGYKVSPEARQKASQLFAKVLDAPGGGLQIMTIHSLCQSLLGSFPEEAGLAPGFKPVEGREQTELYREALSAMIVASETSGDDWIVQNMQSMALNMGEDATLAFLQRCAAQYEALGKVPDGDGTVVYTRRLVGLDFAGSIEEMLANACSDSVIDRVSIERIALLNAEWKTPTGLGRADKIRDWLMLNDADRAKHIDVLLECWTTKKGEMAKQGPKNDAYDQVIQHLFQWGRNLKEQVTLADYAERLAGALQVGKAFAVQYEKSKSERGLLDFDDMIRKTAAMLKSGGMAEWIRYKLDRQIDHILVDEAQDTNASQWDIIDSLSGDFFSGLGAKGERVRTVFSVGDFKQAIFGFQGTDPKTYEEAGVSFEQKILQSGGELHRLELSQSFRSTQPVLEFVNAVVRHAGSHAFGLSAEIAGHIGAKPDCGMIELFAPVLPPNADAYEVADDENSEENWLTKEKAILAHRIAAYVKQLIDEKPVLACTGKELVPGDIMILLRSRSDLAASLVGRLHAAGVPVSGIDRLKLTEPIAVQDIMSAVRFVLQPGDDMSLACLLVSPLFGWSQDKLLQYGYRPAADSLWAHIRGQAEISSDIAALRTILASADFTTPYQFLETILSGPLQGRKKMVARLGAEALVPIEELLNTALQFEQNRGGTLQAFLAWFESGDSDVKREGISGSNEVRILTVHGSKGLQAPVVILADVTGDPKKKPAGSTELLVDDGSRLPLLSIRKAEKVRRLAEVSDMQKARELQEHNRLLYVAITRAEERLVMAGALGKQARGVAAPESWYTAILAGMEELGCEWEPHAPWNKVMRYIGKDAPILDNIKANQNKIAVEIVEPLWLTTDAPTESKPPRPLVPSHIGIDDYGDAPATPAMRAAAEKGRLIHGVFERLTGVDTPEWEAAAAAWLSRNNVNAGISNTDIMKSVKRVADKGEWSVYFGTNARAEVPLAAVVGETVITGRVDRLVIEPDVIRVLDFKTGRNVPNLASDLPIANLRQMAHYVAALEVIFPGKHVEAAILFTHAPSIMMLTPDDLAAHKPAS
jgi:ATP-dependent helicase/nuclease subunit A